MSNDQAHDTRVSTAPERVAQAVALSVAAIPASGAPVISSVIDNGDGTLTINGSGFGTKLQAAPRYWEMGSDVRLDGATRTAPSVGDKAPDAAIWGSYYTDPGAGDPQDSEGIKVVTDNARHAGVDRHWRAWGKGTLLSPLFMPVLSGDDGREFYFAYRIHTGARFGLTRTYVTTESPVGSFNVSSTRQGGEVCDLLDSQGTLVEAGKYQLSWVSPSGVITLSPLVGAAEGTAGNLQGFTLRGVDSGAEITISAASDDLTAWSVKHIRFFQDGLGAPSQFYGSWTNVNNGQVTARIYDESSDYTSGPPRLNVSDSGVGGPGRNFDNQWVLLEVVGDLKTNDGWVEWRLNGQRVNIATGIDTSLITSTSPVAPSNIGMDSPGFSAVSGADVGFGADFGEMYFDSSSKRVVITDSADLATSTVFEIQRPQSWVDDAVTVAKYDGEITGQAYVHVLCGTDYSGGVAI